VLVDVRQNARRLTVVVPWSLRATPRPTVSMPVSWDELDDAVRNGDASALSFDAAQAAARLRPT
jgi:bifunctional non-homologous end joining protein LigD